MYVGIDIHKVNCPVTVLDTDGTEVDRYSIKNTKRGWSRFVERTPHDSEIAIEASTASCSVYDFLVEHGYEVKVAHPREVRLIATSKKKTDTFDSKILAQLLRTGFLPMVTMPSRETRAERELHRHRIDLGKKRTRIQIQIKSLLSRTTIPDEEINLLDLLTVKGITELKTIQLKPAEEFVLTQLLKGIEFLSNEIAEVDKELRKLAHLSEEAKIIMTVPGISYYSAMVIVNEIGDITRFASAKHLASFIGIVPSLYQSGEKRITGRITRTGNPYLRWILNQCVTHTVRHASPIREFYLRVKERKGAACARVAAERKLATILYHMLKNKEEYRYQDQGLTERKWKLVYGISLGGES